MCGFTVYLPTLSSSYPGGSDFSNRSRLFTHLVCSTCKVLSLLPKLSQSKRHVDLEGNAHLHRFQARTRTRLVIHQYTFPDPNGTQNLKEMHVFTVFTLGHEQAEHPHCNFSPLKQTFVGNQQDNNVENTILIVLEADAQSD